MVAGNNGGGGGLNGKGDYLMPYFIADFLLALCASSLNIQYPSTTLRLWFPVHSELDFSFQFWVL
jgi:hypothetical protein